MVKDLVSNQNTKAPCFKNILDFGRPFDFCCLSKMICEAFLTFVSYLFGSTVFADFQCFIFKLVLYLSYFLFYIRPIAWCTSYLSKEERENSNELPQSHNPTE